MRPTRFSKIFGSGPFGLTISLLLLYIAHLLNNRLALPPLSGNRILLNSIFYASIAATLVIGVWSFTSLPAADRGNTLCTSGAFRYVRHPLYAAFLSVFNFGLAVYLNSIIYIVWAVLLHPVWHYLIRYEESMMIGIFGETYLEYQKKTGRFFPRLKILT